MLNELFVFDSKKHNIRTEIVAGIMTFILGMISYVIINICCGKFKKLTPMMYVLAVMFVLKYIFI